MKKLKKFCTEFGFDETEVRKENDDIIIIASGEEFINEKRFFDELPQRGKPLSRKKRGRQKLPRTKSGKRVWQGNNRGRLKNFKNQKTKQIERLNREIADLQIQIGNQAEPDSDLEYTLHTRQLELLEAEEELQKAKDRDEELLAKRKAEVEKKTK